MFFFICKINDIFKVNKFFFASKNYSSIQIYASEEIDWCCGKRFARHGSAEMEGYSAESKQVEWFGSGGHNTWRVLKARRRRQYKIIM